MIGGNQTRSCCQRRGVTQPLSDGPQVHYVTEQHFILRGFTFVCFERNLEDSIPQGISVERLNSDDCLVVVCHRHEAKAFTFVRLKISDNFDALHSTERSE